MSEVIEQACLHIERRWAAIQKHGFRSIGIVRMYQRCIRDAELLYDQCIDSDVVPPARLISLMMDMDP